MSGRTAHEASDPTCSMPPAGGPVIAPGRAPLQRRLLHGLLIGLGWLLFGWSWMRVTADRPEVGELRVLMVGAVVVVPLLTLSWVAHNVGIYRRKGPRKAGQPVPMRYERDFNGRTIAADFDRLVSARRIDVMIEGGVKRFVDVDAATPAPPVLPRAVELL